MEEWRIKVVTPALLVFVFVVPLPVRGQENMTPAVSIHMAALQGDAEAVPVGSGWVFSNGPESPACRRLCMLSL